LHGLGAFFRASDFLITQWMRKMRACFLGQSICALGFGVATLQAPRLLLDAQNAEPDVPANQNETEGLDLGRPACEDPDMGPL
jgi:hypothetical protein